MTVGKVKLVNGTNYLNETGFKRVTDELEKGEHIRVYIDCIGHTRAHNEGLAYKEAIEEKYGENVVINQEGGEFTYKLKELPNND